MMAFVGALWVAVFVGGLVAAPERPEASAGWVKIERSDMTRVFGMRFRAQLSELEVLSAKPEEWTAPHISADGATVYAGARNGTIEARALSTWDVLWKRKGLGSIGASMAEHRENLLVGSGSWLLALDRETGDERWRVDLGGSVGGRIVLTGTVAIVPVRPNAFAAIDAASGRALWRLKRPTPEGITLRGQAAPAIDAGRNRVFLGFSDGALVAASLDRGDTLWTQALATATQAFPDIDAQPVILGSGESILAASYAGGLAKIEAKTGRIEWRRDVPRITAMAPSGSSIVVASDGDGQVLGLIPDQGTVRWRFRFSRGSPTEPISIGRGMVVVGSSLGPLAVLDAISGKPLQLVAPGSGASVPPAFRDPDLALLSNKGLLLALRYGEGIGMTR